MEKIEWAVIDNSYIALVDYDQNKIYTKCFGKVVSLDITKHIEITKWDKSMSEVCLVISDKEIHLKKSNMVTGTELVLPVEHLMFNNILLDTENKKQIAIGDKVKINVNGITVETVVTEELLNSNMKLEMIDD